MIVRIKRKVILYIDDWMLISVYFRKIRKIKWNYNVF